MPEKKVQTNDTAAEGTPPDDAATGSTRPDDTAAGRTSADDAADGTISPDDTAAGHPNLRNAENAYAQKKKRAPTHTSTQTAARITTENLISGYMPCQRGIPTKPPQASIKSTARTHLQ